MIMEGRSGSDIVVLAHGLRVKDLNLVVMGIVSLLELLKAWARPNPKVRFLDLEENQPNPEKEENNTKQCQRVRTESQLTRLNIVLLSGFSKATLQRNISKR